MILLANKNKTVISETTTTSGITSVTINQEQSAILFSLHVSSLDLDVALSVRVYAVVGSSEKLLYETKTIRQAGNEFIDFSVQAGGDIRVDATYTGVATYEIQAKAIPSLPLPEAVPVVLLDGYANREQKMIELLTYNNELLEKMVNHLRVITNINKDDGESF